MPRFQSNDFKLIAWTVVALVFLTIAAACSSSYGYAMRTASDYESRIEGAKAKIEHSNERLLESLAQLSSSERLTMPAVQRMLEMTKRYPGQRGMRIAAQELKQHSPRVMRVTPEFTANVGTSLKLHQKEEFKNRRDLVRLQQEYKDDLGSFWLGMWMRKAGYPSPEVLQPVKRSNPRPVRPAPPAGYDAPQEARVEADPLP